MEDLYTRIKAKILEILGRYEDNQRLRIPKEGAERSIRGWFMCELIHNLLGWKMDRIILAERFDLSLYDDRGHMVVYIETKTPTRDLTKRDRRSFFNRTRPYGTIKHAIITNGYQWERYRGTGNGIEQEPEVKLLIFDKRSPSRRQMRKFFKPLQAKYYTIEG